MRKLKLALVCIYIFLLVFILSFLKKAIKEEDYVQPKKEMTKLTKNVALLEGKILKENK